MGREFVSQLEVLEARRLLSAAIQLSEGTLRIQGTRRADDIRIESTAPTTAGVAAQIRVVVNGRVRLFATSSVSRVIVDAGAGDDLVLAGPQPPVLGLGVLPLGSGPTATLLGGEGNDTLAGREGDDVISGGAGRDLIFGGSGDDTLDGGSGRDVVQGDSGADQILGGNGDDVIYADGDDTVSGGKGFDLWTLTSIGDDPVTSDVEGATRGTLVPDVSMDGTTLVVRGTRRADRIRLSLDAESGAMTATVNGQAVWNIPRVSFSRVRIEGGAGDDDLAIGNSESTALGAVPQPITFPLELLGGAGNDTLGGAGGDDVLKGDLGDDVIFGRQGSDALFGGAGQDEVNGDSGDDWLDGGDGDDTLHGGVGNNTFVNGEHYDGGITPPVLVTTN